MKLHRFLFTDNKLAKELWVNKPELVHQWQRVLRYKLGDQLVLFDGQQTERLYKIVDADAQGFKLALVTELVRIVPAREVYLFWSLLKKDNNDLVLQKCTELGVSHFVPVEAERSVATGFNAERAVKIVTEAAEQCGRSDIPRVREPLSLEAVLAEFKDKIALFYAEKGSEPEGDQPDYNANSKDAVGVFVGPEGGWSETEKERLSLECKKLGLGSFTLRAETATIIAASKLLG